MQNSTNAWWLASLMGLSGCLAGGEEMSGGSADEELAAYPQGLSENAVRTRVVGNNTRGAGDDFGNSLALSDDGLTMVVGASTKGRGSPGEPYASGSAYVFTRPSLDAKWVQKAYLKASNAGEYDNFGQDVAISGDGKYVAVGANGEDGDGTLESDDSVSHAGAAYVYRHDAGSGGWVQDAYVKASLPQESDGFGFSVALSTDGATLAVGAIGGQDLAPGAKSDTGSAYVFRRSASGWTEQAVVTASNADNWDDFGWDVALDGSGDLLAVGARREASNATGVDGNQDENTDFWAGAAYVFKFQPTEDGSDVVWQQQSYIKRSYSDDGHLGGDQFGFALALSSDGSTLAVGAPYEDSAARQVNGDQTSTSANSSGAVWVYGATSNGSWVQEAYVKPNNTDEGDQFGCALALSSNGNYLVVGADYESSNATQAVGGDPFNNDDYHAGAAYVFERTGTEWAQQAYLKPAHSRRGDTPPRDFGRSVDVNGAGDVIAAGTTQFTFQKAGVFTFTDP